MYSDYPSNTKIIAYHLFANDKMEIISREIYTAFQWVGDVGGLF